MYQMSSNSYCEASGLARSCKVPISHLLPAKADLQFVSGRDKLLYSEIHY